MEAEKGWRQGRDGGGGRDGGWGGMEAEGEMEAGEEWRQGRNGGRIKICMHGWVE